MQELGTAEFNRTQENRVYAAHVRGVFRLATGVYALGMLIRLLQRRSGPAAEKPIAAVSAVRAAVVQDAPNSTLGSQPLAEQRSDAMALHTDGRSTSDPDHGQAATLGEPSPVKDASTGRSQQPRQLSGVDQLPRERLFGMARASGHRLEDLITMSRDDLIDAIAPSKMEQKEHSPVNSSVHDEITNRPPPS